MAYGTLNFGYRIVKIWEKSPEELLHLPLALLPLVPLTNISAEDLPGAVRRMENRIDSEAPSEERGLLWTTTWLLLGLKYDPEFSRQLLKGVREMKESSTYQYTLDEGRKEGMKQGLKQGLEQGLEQGNIEEARRLLLMIGGKRLGPADAKTQASLKKITSLQNLEQLATRLLEVESWMELLNKNSDGG